MTTDDAMKIEHLAQSNHAIQVSLSSLFVKLARERYNQHTHGAPFRNHLLSDFLCSMCSTPSPPLLQPPSPIACSGVSHPAVLISWVSPQI